MFTLTNEDLKKILGNMDETEIACLPTIYNVVQKIVGVINEKPGRAEIVDMFKSVAVNISLINEMNEKE